MKKTKNTKIKIYYEPSIKIFDGKPYVVIPKRILKNKRARIVINDIEHGNYFPNFIVPKVLH